MEATTSLSEPNPKRQRIMIICGDDDILKQIEKLNDRASSKAIIFDTSKEDIRISAQSSGTTTEPLSHSRRAKDGPMTCVVCGGTANGYNFDVISCESCKSFFRRNALRTPTLKCTRQNQCNVTLQSRRRCSACRLAKCFSSGMKRERILIAEQKAETRRNYRDQPNSVEQLIPQPSPLLSADNLTSMLDQELLLFSDCLQGNALQTKKGLLSPEELQRVVAIEDLYKKRIELAHDGLPWDPAMYTTDFLRQLNSHSVPLIRLLTFFKQIPEFDGLNVDDKVTLIKFNLLPLLCINCTLSYRTESDSFVESDTDIPWDPAALQSVYGPDGYQDIRKIFDKFLYIAKYDQKIIQLALITFVLTKGFAVTAEEPILNDFRGVYRAQNYFTELLWKYMETVHGSEIAVQMFSNMIAHFMTWQILQVKLGEIISRNVSAANTNDISPFMKALLHIS